MKRRKMRQQRTVPMSAQLILFLVAIVYFTFFATGCASTPPPKPKGYELPPALREVFRGGELAPLQAADGPALGMPSPDDLVSHTCISNPIFDLNGRYLRTSVKCW